MKPTVGRIVHFGYVERFTAHTGPAVERVKPMVLAPAIITKVCEGGGVCLHVFLPDGAVLRPRHAEDLDKGVEFSAKLEADKWTWPPRA